MPKSTAEMLHRRYTWLVVIAIIAVAVVFVAPSVDLQPTALRAWQAACAMFVAIAMTVHTPASYDPRTQPFFTKVSSRWRKHGPVVSPHLTCILLC